MEIILLTKSKRDTNLAELAKQILENYQPKSVENIQNALKDIFDPTYEVVLRVN